jgi:hypothetical protein
VISGGNFDLHGKPSLLEVCFSFLAFLFPLHNESPWWLLPMAFYFSQQPIHGVIVQLSECPECFWTLLDSLENALRHSITKEKQFISVRFKCLS